MQHPLWRAMTLQRSMSGSAAPSAMPWKTHFGAQVTIGPSRRACSASAEGRFTTNLQSTGSFEDSGHCLRAGSPLNEAEGPLERRQLQLRTSSVECLLNPARAGPVLHSGQIAVQLSPSSQARVQIDACPFGNDDFQIPLVRFEPTRLRPLAEGGAARPFVRLEVEGALQATDVQLSLVSLNAQIGSKVRNLELRLMVQHLHLSGRWHGDLVVDERCAGAAFAAVRNLLRILR